MKKRGLGVGSMFYGIGYGFNRPDIGAAHVEVAEDGTATLFTGVCDLGQGIQTLLAQIVGTELGMPISAIRVVDADTGQHARLRSNVRQPRNVRAGTGSAKCEPRREGAPFRDGRPNDGRRARRSRNCATATSALGCRQSATSASSRSSTRCTSRANGASAGAGRTSRQKTSIRPTSQGDAYQTFGWATQLAEVEVDTETGFVQVTRLVSATDAGRAINPMGVEGQVQGGAAMGLGYALYEQHVVDHGRARTRDRSLSIWSPRRSMSPRSNASSWRCPIRMVLTARRAYPSRPRSRRRRRS